MNETVIDETFIMYSISYPTLRAFDRFNKTLVLKELKVSLFKHNCQWITEFSRFHSNFLFLKIWIEKRFLVKDSVCVEDGKSQKYLVASSLNKGDWRFHFTEKLLIDENEFNTGKSNKPETVNFMFNNKHINPCFSSETFVTKKSFLFAERKSSKRLCFHKRENGKKCYFFTPSLCMSWNLSRN